MRHAPVVHATEVCLGESSLVPDLAEGHLALGYYFSSVQADYEGALEEYTIARRLAPNDATVHRRIGTIHRRRGEWDDALESFRKATEINPRAPSSVADLAATLTWMRRYDDAVPAWRRLRVLAPDHDLLYYQAWTYLNQPGGVGEAVQALRELAETFGVSMQIPDATRPMFRASTRVLCDSFSEMEPEPLGASPSAAGKLLSMGIIRSLAGEDSIARQYFDSARVAYEARIEASLETPNYHSALAVSYAGLGRAEDAIREAWKAVDLAPVSEDAFYGPFHLHGLAEVHVMVGDHDAALDHLEYLLSITCPISPPLLEADPIWDPIRGHPRFRAMVEG
ncbi:tetratricopeptide repeat protein [Gemmatimonadota bacterium]